MNVQALDRLLTMFEYDCERVSAVGEAFLGTHVSRGEVRARAERLRRYQAQVAVLLENPGFKQRTPEWYEARKSIVTASELLQATGSRSAQRQFLKRKCFPGTGFSLAGVPAVRHGVIYEDVACRAYEARNGVKVHEFGLLPNRRIECFGASPDGICSNGIMLEIKCVYSREIVDGYVKPEYYSQMQGQMHTAELEECDFLECKITEYESEAAFAADASPDEAARGTALTEKGMEKGAITFHYDDEEGKEVYGYSPYETSTEGVVAWAAAQEEFKTVVFYKMEVYNCQRIAYDPAFMEETEPKIRDSFALFTKYRDNPDLIDVDYPESARKAPRTQNTLASFAFVGIEPPSGGGSATETTRAPATSQVGSGNGPRSALLGNGTGSGARAFAGRTRFAPTKLKSFAFV